MEAKPKSSPPFPGELGKRVHTSTAEQLRRPVEVMLRIEVVLKIEVALRVEVALEGGRSVVKRLGMIVFEFSLIVNLCLSIAFDS